MARKIAMPMGIWNDQILFEDMDMVESFKQGNFSIFIIGFAEFVRILKVKNYKRPIFVSIFETKHTGSNIFTSLAGLC